LVGGSGVPEPIFARPDLLRSGCGGGTANVTTVAAHLLAGRVRLGGGRPLGSSPPFHPALRQRWLLVGWSGLHGGTAAALATTCSNGGPHHHGGAWVVFFLPPMMRHSAKAYGQQWRGRTSAVTVFSGTVAEAPTRLGRPCRWCRLCLPR
jgi:hypothetical protein